MLITHFNDFITEKNIEVGDNLNNILSKRKDKFSKNLLSFLNSDKIKDEFGYNKIEWFDENQNLMSVFDDKGKERKIKLGKLLKVLGYNLPYNEYEVNDFIINLKKGNTEGLKLVSGDDIYTMYDCKNYAPNTPYSQLHSSCMSFSHRNKYLEIYAKNPNQVNLLVLMKNDLVYGRAIVWVDDNKKFMDRIYCVNPADVIKFKNYAKENNFVNKPFDVTLDNKGDYEYYPYMDTLEYYYPDSGMLSIDGDKIDEKNTSVYYLKNTDGTVTSDKKNMVYSRAYSEYINRDEAVWSDIEDSWYYEEDESLYKSELYGDLIIYNYRVDFAIDSNYQLFFDEPVRYDDDYTLENGYGDSIEIYRFDTTFEFLNDEKNAFDYDKLKTKFDLDEYIRELEEFISIDDI